MPAAEGITYQQTTTTTTTKEVKEKKEKPKSKTAQQVKAEVGSVLCWCLLWGEIIVCPSGDSSRSCLVLCVPARCRHCAGLRRGGVGRDFSAEITTA